MQSLRAIWAMSGHTLNCAQMPRCWLWRMQGWRWQGCASTRQLCRPTTRHGWALQQSWWYLCENLFKQDKNVVQQLWERGVRRPTDTKKRAKRERRCSRCPAEIPLQPLETPQWSRYFPAAPGKNHARADVHTAASAGPYNTTGGQALEELWAMKDPHRSRLILKDCSP